MKQRFRTVAAEPPNPRDPGNALPAGIPAEARPVADVLLSQEGRELRIGPRVRPRG